MAVMSVSLWTQVAAKLATPANLHRQSNNPRLDGCRPRRRSLPCPVRLSWEPRPQMVHVCAGSSQEDGFPKRCSTRNCDPRGSQADCPHRRRRAPNVPSYRRQSAGRLEHAGLTVHATVRQSPPFWLPSIPEYPPTLRRACATIFGSREARLDVTMALLHDFDNVGPPRSRLVRLAVGLLGAPNWRKSVRVNLLLIIKFLPELNFSLSSRWKA